MLRCIALNTNHHTGCCHCPLPGDLSTRPQHPPHYPFFSLIPCSYMALRAICIFSKQLPPKAQERERCVDPTAYLSLTPELCYWAVLSRHGEKVGTQPLSSSLGQAAPSFLLPYSLSHCLPLEDYLSPWLRTQIFLLSASRPEEKGQLGKSI